MKIHPLHQAGTAPCPDRVYHATAAANRQSILERGLLYTESDSYQWGGPGGVYFDIKYRDQSQYGIDIWAVDVRGLDLELDQDGLNLDTERGWEGHQWWVVWHTNIAPERLRLLLPASCPAHSVSKR